jgi:hypothetical protein
MAQPRTFTTTLAKTVLACAGLLTTAQMPMATAIALSILLTVVSLLALVAALSGLDYRRAAAYKVLKLLLQARIGPMPSDDASEG